jgi:hypothetical protein
MDPGVSDRHPGSVFNTDHFNLKKEVVRFSETALLISQTARHDIPAHKTQ